MEQIGPYRVHRLLGQGGMGAVYEAEEPLSGRRVALKVLTPELARDEQARARFRNEMQLLARVEHPNLVRSLASLDIDGTLVLALELLEGPTLREVLAARGRLPWDEALAVAAALASALGAMHGCDPPIVHRDLKPENVLVLSGGSIKLLDLGIAKAGEGAAGTLGLGTLQYMAPEQIDGLPLDARTDLHALGLLLYELIAGRPPFQAASPRALMELLCTAAPPPLDPEARRGLPRGVEGLMLRLLAKTPAERPQSASEVLASLEAFLPADGPASLPPRSSGLPAAPISTPSPSSGRAALAASAATASDPPISVQTRLPAIPTALPVDPSPPPPASRPEAPPQRLLDRELPAPLAVGLLLLLLGLAALAGAALRRL